MSQGIQALAPVWAAAPVKPISRFQGGRRGVNGKGIDTVAVIESRY